MAINFKLRDRYEIDPDDDPMSRDWVGYSALMSSAEIFQQNRGIWYLNPERMEWESYATFSHEGTIVAVAAIDGIERLPWPHIDDGRAMKSAIVGRPLGPGDRAHDYFLGKPVDHERNPVTYIADPPDPSEGNLALSHWCLLANPATYDVEAALRALPVVLWNIGRLRRIMPAPGDPVLVWRTLAADGYRGLIGRGVVDGQVALVPDDEDPFWADSARGLIVERRVPIRWTPLDEPVWLDQAPELLGALKVSRSQGFSMVAEEPEIWTAAARLAHAGAGDRRGRMPRGQGWMTVIEQRLAIEGAAMDAAVAHYQANGYTVEDVHLRESYDVLCSRKDDEIHVEVKGTTTDALRVLLTRGEVLHARAASHAALFVLHGLTVESAEEPLTAWTEKPPLIIDPWVPADEDLAALSYQYTLPAGRTLS